MLPPWTSAGTLPPGEHPTTWPECVERYGWNPYRRSLLEGLLRALQNLRDAGCRRVFLDGSFVTTKEAPADDRDNQPKGVVVMDLTAGDIP